MKVVSYLFFVLFLLSYGILEAQDFNSEGELKEKANELFEQEKFEEANPLFAQLLSLYPQDPIYNFKYGACLLATEADKQKPLKYLEFAVLKRADPLAYYYLGRAHHLNYSFAKAVKTYSSFKSKASTEQRQKYQIDRKIEMCKNGSKLLSTLNEVQVVDRNEIAAKDFFRVYDLEGINGKLITKPDNFQTKYDKKIEEKSIIFLPNNAKEVYYSSYGKKGENGKDIYRSIKIGEDSWSDPVKLGENINTPYDEEYPYILPDGRTMYFASKGHTSMGGYDLFKSTFDQSTGIWTEPENLDFAFSSADDDILFVTDAANQVAFFASNRSSDYGKFTVYKVLVDKKPANVSVIKGKFIAENNASLKRAKVTVVDKATNETIGVYETDDNGHYSVEIAENGGSYQFSLETTADNPIHTGIVNIPKQEEFEVLGQELRLVGVGDDQQLVIKNIFDGTTAANANNSGPQVSSELIRKKANLEVNYSSSDLPNSAGLANSEDEKTETRSEATNSSAEITDPNNTSASNDDVENIASDSGSSIALIEELDLIEKEIDEDILRKKKQLGLAFNTAVKKKNTANALFDEKENIAKEGALTELILSKDLEAKEMALQAAFSANAAQNLEQQYQKDLEKSQEIKKEVSKTKENINRGDLSVSKNEIQTIENSKVDLLNSDFNKNLDAQIKVVDKNLAENSKRISSSESKNVAFEEEIIVKENELDKLNKQAKLTSISDSEKSDIERSTEELKLDVEDLNYQKINTKKSSDQFQDEKKALDIKRQEIQSIGEQISSIGSASETEVTFSEEDRISLLAELKSFNENDQFAYIAPLSLENSYSSSDDNSINSGSALDPTISTNSELTLLGINSKYESELLGASNISGDGAKASKKIDIYDNWITELKTTSASKKTELNNIQNVQRKSILQNEIDQIEKAITAKAELKNNMELQLTANAPADISEQSSESNSTFASKNVGPSNSNNNIEIPKISGVDEIDDVTLIDESFTNFDFEQDASIANAQPSLEMQTAKRSLFEANQLSKQSAAKRKEAYELPTVEERQAAFDRANVLKTASEQKQLEAAEKFAEFNKKEYLVNKGRIENANQYEEEFESSNLDLANLLNEEAEVYFNQAEVIRSGVDPASRLSIKEVELQKAYDYEVLALRKQKEAITKLNLANDDYLNPVESNEGVVNITDAEVLSVNNSNTAKQRADSLAASVIDLEKEAARLADLAQSASEGNNRDSLTALSESILVQAVQNKNKAAVYYQRETQLNSNSTSNNNVASKGATVLTKPRTNSASQFDTSVSLDTVEISDEREDLVLQTKSFVDYTRALKNKDRIAREADIEYSKALELAEEKKQLEKSALVESKQAETASDPAEKERLVKSAQVINQKIESIDNSIDSINTSIKVKNYLFQSSELKMKNSLANLSEMEQKEIKQLAIGFEGELPQSSAAITSNTSNIINQGSNQLNSSETSEGNNKLTNLESIQLDPTQIELIDGGRSSVEGTLIDKSTPENTTNNNFNIPSDGKGKKVENSPKADAEKNIPRKQSIAKTKKVSLEKINEIPRVIKEAIFVTIGSNESVYDVGNPIPVNVELPEGLVYKVQVGAFRNPIAQNLFTGFAPITAEKVPSGITRYTAGLFLTESNAIVARDQIRKLGYPDAFVVAFLNGKRMSIVAARNQSGEVVASTNIREEAKVDNTSNNSLNSESVVSSSDAEQKPLSSRFSSPEKQAAISTLEIKKIFYTVQIGVFSKPVEKGTFSYPDINVVELSNGLIRYNSGIFSNSLDAADLKITISTEVKDAFVTAYDKGKRISINEAARLKNK